MIRKPKKATMLIFQEGKTIMKPGTWPWLAADEQGISRQKMVTANEKKNKVGTGLPWWSSG